MCEPKPPKSPREKAAHRERLRWQGLQPIQFWVPDVRSPAFRTEAHRQSLVVAQSGEEHDDQDFVDAISDETIETR
jgi:Antitoxin MazE-like